MPICITGMHRSGTSLVANLLHKCGLYLGEHDDLLPATDDNIDGYWEHRKFVAVNDEILRVFGGTWDYPAAVRFNARVSDDRFGALRVRAELLLDEFSAREPWGWKDPRSCLTIPFWASLNGMVFPFLSGKGSKLKAIVCLRHPAEVFQSLRGRKFTPSSAGFELWVAYNKSVLNATLPDDRIVTHYESFFQDPATELGRLLQFIGLSATVEQITRACHSVSGTLRHYNANSTALTEMYTSSEMVNLYAQLCEEADFKPRREEK